MPSPLLLKNELWAADLSSRVEQGSTLMGTFVVKYKYKCNQIFLGVKVIIDLNISIIISSVVKALNLCSLQNQC